MNHFTRKSDEVSTTSHNRRKLVPGNKNFSSPPTMKKDSSSGKKNKNDHKEAFDEDVENIRL